ncbi:MAG: addiction module protein [Alcanivorax sp.]|nr:addiction module protein [Alcanivorax sp.]
MSSTEDIINQALDDLWAEEAEARLDAYEHGDLCTLTLHS